MRGLIVNRFALYGIRASNVEALNVYGCYIGTDANGSTDFGNGFSGIFLNPAQNNSVSNTGSATAAAMGRNVVSGNNGSGVEIHGAGISAPRRNKKLSANFATPLSV